MAEVGFYIRIEGLDGLLANLQAVDASLRGAAASRVLYAGAQTIQRYAKLNIETGPKTGRTYRLGAIRRGGAVVGYKFHRASAPGESPATDTGKLVNSIRSRKGNEWAMVYVSASYGGPLEFGTGRMAARPFLRPAYEKHKDEVLKAMADQASAELAQAVRG